MTMSCLGCTGSTELTTIPMNRSEVLEILIRSADDQSLDLKEERAGLLLEKTVLSKVDK